MVTAKTKQVTMLLKRTPISERIERLREMLLTAPIDPSAERSHLLTEYYRMSDGEPAPLRVGRSFKYILEKMNIVIRDGELIVGDLTDRVCGCIFNPELDTDWISGELEGLATKSVEQRSISEEDKKTLLEDLEYWKGKTILDREKIIWRELYGDRIFNGIEARLFIDASTLPPGRMNIDYEKVLNKGLSGVIEEVRQELMKIQVKSREDLQKRYILKSMIIACEAVITFAERYAALAGELAAKEKGSVRKRELEEIAEICAWVPRNPARTFHEAVQSFWFTHLARWLEAAASGNSPGRMDQYMYPSYKRDIDEGRITREQALELMGCLWIKFNQLQLAEELSLAEINASGQFQNVTIGGQTSQGRSAVNEVSYLILDLVDHLRLPQPSVSIRYFDGLPEEFLLRAAEVDRIGTGNPAWFNDKYVIATMPYYDVPLAEARDWAPTGCVEMGIPHSSVIFWGSASYSQLKCLELALNNGYDPRLKKQISPATGDPRKFKTYAELVDAFKEQMSYALESSLINMESFYINLSELRVTPFTSALVDDCIKRGKDILEGGARYPKFMTVECVNPIDCANSLYVIKRLVYEDKTLSMDELLDALAANFEGKEELRQQFLAVPKYGNDIDEVDQLVRDVHQFHNEECARQRSYLFSPLYPEYIGVGFNIAYGAFVGATPDGRKAYTPTTDASLSPMPGTDVNAPTALIKSASKADISPAGSSVLNVKFHPNTLKGRDGLKKLLQLIKTYFDLNGYHIQFNVISRETLIDARKHPAQYRDLVVRVGGFSAFWVALPRTIQDNIIARSEHSNF